MAQSLRLHLLLVGLLVFLSQFAEGLKVGADEPTWNYANHGTDWTMDNCGNKVDPQGPYEMKDDAGPPVTPTDWATVCDVSFLTAFTPANITEADHGFHNYVYRINATNGNMGQFYGSDVIVSGPQILWNVT